MSNQAHITPTPNRTMRRRINEYTWASTALGAQANWPAELSTAVTIMLGLDTPAAVYWGEDLVLLHNDAWPSATANDSDLLGQPAKTVHRAAWSSIGPYLADIRAGKLDSTFVEVEGDPHWRHGQLIPLPCADGTNGGLMHHISEAQPAASLQTALHEVGERNRFLERALSHMGDFVYVWDRDKRFVYANAQLEAAWGLPVGEYKGKTLDELSYPAELAERLHRQIEQVLATREPLADIAPYTSPTGVEGYYEYFFNPLAGPDGEVQFVAGVARNVAERIHAEAALRKSEQRYRTLFDSIDEGFCVFQVIFDDNNKPIDYAWLETNPAFERHTGLYNPAGRTARQMVPNLEQHWLDIYGHIALSGEHQRFIEHSEAMGRWFEVDAFRVGEPQERKVALLFANISQRKQAEDALKEADRRKDEFLATLAHELRNPLAAIRSGIDVMQLTAANTDVRDKTLGTLERQTQQLVSLVDDLLEVSRITRGTLQLRKRCVDVAEVITSASESCQPLFTIKNQTLALNVPRHPILVEADPHRLAQVLSNLLNNANKYTAEGDTVELTATSTGDQAVLTVSDTGIGIAEDNLKDIFAMFTQIDGVQDNKNKGLGVGLALAKSLVEMHGGQLEVESAGEGQGSCFYVRLPLANNDPHPITEEEQTIPETTADISGSHRVLIVDDNVDAASTLCMLIEILGNDVTTAHSGREALLTGADFKPQMIFLDIGMPEMDGFETARQIRQQPWGKEVIIVALSGWGQDEDKRKTEEAGFDHHLVKPAELAQLQEVLGRLNPAG